MLNTTYYNLQLLRAVNFQIVIFDNSCQYHFANVRKMIVVCFPVSFSPRRGNDSFTFPSPIFLMSGKWSAPIRTAGFQNKHIKKCLFILPA